MVYGNVFAMLGWLDIPYYSPVRLLFCVIWFYWCMASIKHIEFSRVIPGQLHLTAKLLALVLGPLIVFAVIVMEAFKKSSESDTNFIANFHTHLFQIFSHKSHQIQNDIPTDFIELLDSSGQNISEIYRSSENKKHTSDEVNLTKEIIFFAIDSGASDILIDPRDDKTYLIRLRIDGLLRDYQEIETKEAFAVVNSIKAVSRMDIADRRRPQDGSFMAETSKGTVSFRVASAGVLNGEKLSIRVLGQNKGLANLTDLGISEKQYNKLHQAINQPSGMILLCGPTGSGKTTTLYSILHSINASSRNIISVEDPIEYHLGNVSQIEVNTKADITFAKALRSVLRQDPDVICIGEIRDEETAKIALQAAQTGHLVIATMHSNSNVSAVVRLIDLGVKPLLIASSLSLVVSQRLVRRLCQQCKIPETLTAASIERLGSKGVDYKNIFTSSGCPVCGDTGFKGRLGVYDIMSMDDDIRQHILGGKFTGSSVANYENKRSKPMMKKEALKRVLTGVTTMQEVKRVVSTT